jgi:hypothetical protein
MTNNEFFMSEIFIIQVIGSVLGSFSMGAADLLYHSGYIRQRPHSVWVSCTITLIFLPVLAWTSTVFLGFGTLSQVFISILGGMIFFWIYHHLPKLPPAQKLRHGVPRPRLSSR